MTTAARPEADLDALCVNATRTLSVDAAQAAKGFGRAETSDTAMRCVP